MLNRKILFMVLLMAFAAVVEAESITFTFANGQITNDGTYKYYEFDVMASSDQTGTQLGDSQVYINYSTSAFGNNIVTAGGVAVTKAELLMGQYFQFPPPPGQFKPYYDIINNVDNTPSRFATTVEYADALVGAPWTNFVLTTAKAALHVKMRIENDSHTAGLSYQQVLMQNQIYQSYNSQQTKYNPVTATDTDDASLNPIAVELASFTAALSNGAVVLDWQTASEINHAGFNVFRSHAADSGFVRINSEMIIARAEQPAQGSHYRYIDAAPHEGSNYYKLQDVSLSGQTSLSATISVSVSSETAEKPQEPESFELKQNFPNPFNPETRIEYQLPREEFVELGIYNLGGQMIRSLVSENISSGFYAVVWDGRDDSRQLVGSGVYIMRLKAGAFVMNKRITLLR